MLIFQPLALLLIPVTLSVAFLLWVLWHMHKDEHRRR